MLYETAIAISIVLQRILASRKVAIEADYQSKQLEGASMLRRTSAGRLTQLIGGAEVLQVGVRLRFALSHRHVRSVDGSAKQGRSSPISSKPVFGVRVPARMDPLSRRASKE